MTYLPPLVRLSDAQPWAWFVLCTLALVGVAAGWKWPRLVTPALLGLGLSGVAAYLLTVRILAVDPNRDLGYIPLWAPLAWCAAVLGMALPWASMWAFGVGVGGTLAKPKTGGQITALGLSLLSVVAFQVAMWCSEVVFD